MSKYVLIFDVLLISCFSCDRYLADISTKNTLGKIWWCHAGSFIYILLRFMINNDFMIEKFWWLSFSIVLLIFQILIISIIFCVFILIVENVSKSSFKESYLRTFNKIWIQEIQNESVIKIKENYQCLYSRILLALRLTFRTKMSHIAYGQPVFFGWPFGDSHLK